MDKELRQRILNEAIRIGDELLSQAERDEHGLSWQTMSVDHANNRQVVWRKSEGIYSGVSGIVLFLLELYRQTKDEKYLQAAVEGMHWTEWYCQNNPTDYYAFFTGRMGVAYTMLRMAEVTRDNDYLEKALTIAKPCPVFLDSPKTVNDLINGTSGTLLALLHLHAATAQGWLLETINRFIEHLLRSVHHGPVGLYWDRSPLNIRGLCGFSHGAAGVGFVFLELGHYFQNEAFYWLAEQAFLYESHFFDEAKKNWPDFRRRISTPEGYEEHRKAYLAGNLDYFTESQEMNAWCHGAAGIGLSRLRALALLQKPTYKDDVENAIAKTITTDISIKYPAQTYTLCHGAGGNAELFLEAYRLFGDKKYLSLAESVAVDALNFKQEKGTYLSGYRSEALAEDRSLFMGNAGIGYFYLKLREPVKVPSILAPQVNSSFTQNEAITNYAYIVLSKAELYKTVLKQDFKRTLFVLERLFPEEMHALFNGRRPVYEISAKEEFIQGVTNLLQISPPRQKKYLRDVFTLELEKVRAEEAIESYALLYVKERIETERAKKLVEDLRSASAQTLRLILNPTVTIILTKWDWSSGLQDDWLSNFSAGTAEQPVILRPTSAGVIEEKLSSIAYFVLIAFQDGNRLESVIESVTASFDSVSSQQKKFIRETVIQQVQQAVLAGILEMV
ncbi:MAG: hypothetical protein GWN55_09745 [Phycisphaerae bacterium]|nr:hypothetical protein [Phycisphaerae bacterium]NIV01588.1 hypothetical protein [Phycisphaerae bacterium]NIV69417.1 hypothetical protein [Phycisphaerae bacterium]NIW20435.1 hypothetical protein [candidate division KSB1 bacterium]NIX32566.1 hypothetical protein [Phycisphaerae bacterium]